MGTFVKRAAGLYDIVNTTSSQPAWVIRAHVDQQEQMYKKNFTAKQIQQAETLLEMCQAVFPHNRCYMNYRQKFIAVKIEQPRLEDLNKSSADNLLTYVGRNGWGLKLTKNQSKSVVFEVA